MYQKVSKYNLSELSKILIGKNINFISDCEFFPNFNVNVYCKSITIAKNSEYLIHCVNLRNHKKIDIGSNMKNLQFLLL